MQEAVIFWTCATARTDSMHLDTRKTRGKPSRSRVDVRRRTSGLDWCDNSGTYAEDTVAWIAVTSSSMAYSNKKHSYRRDSAGRRSLRRSSSFKVINWHQSKARICDFLLVNNTTLHPISHRLPDIAHCWSNIAFDKGVSVVHAFPSFSVISANKYC